MMKDDYLVTDKPTKAIFLFALPIMLGNFFQQMYTMADSIIVGRFVGEEALAAVGASYSLTSVFIAIAIGGGAGATILTSRAFGAGNYKEMKESISTALFSFLIISVVLAVAGYFLSPAIMTSLNTPDDIFIDSVTYLRIYFLGLPFLFMYNILSSVFNSLGKSRIPLYLLLFSSLLNIVLDLVAVVEIGLGVAGAAWATLFSQALSACLSFLILLRVLSKYSSSSNCIFSKEMLPEMAGIAIPSILQQSTISIGMMLVQSVVNAFGSDTLAGYSVCIRVDSLVTVPLSSVGNAMSPYTAQNLGAGQIARIEKGYKASLLIILGFGVLSCFILEFFTHDILAAFLGENGSAMAYSTGEGYLSFLGWFYSLLGFAMVTGGVLRGYGDMKLFTIASLANLSFRVIVSMLFSPIYGVSVVWKVVPAGWLIYFLLCFISYFKHAEKGN